MPVPLPIPTSMLRAVLAVALVSAACADAVAPTRIAARVVATPLATLPPDTTVSALTITISEMELTPCASPSAMLWRWALPEAHAHVDSTPTLVGSPVVIDLVAGATFRVGTFTPPDGRFCAIEVRSTPADADAFGVSEPSLGTTLRLVATHAGQPVVQTTALSFQQRYPLAPALQADGDAAIVVTLNTTTWFTEPGLPWSHPFNLTQTLLMRAFASATVTWHDASTTGIDVSTRQREGGAQLAQR